MNTLFRNFLTTLRRFKLASSLNVIGLSIAYTAFMVIIMQVYFEYSFDTHATNSERIYRINAHGEILNNGDGSVLTPRPLMDEFKETPEIEDITIIKSAWLKGYVTVEKDGINIGFNENITKACENFPAFFDLKLVDGNFTDYRANNSTIIPKSLAIKFFGTPYAAGKSITTNNTDTTTIVAVFEDFPYNSQFNNDIYLFFPKDQGVNQWGSANYLTYAKLASNVSPEQATEAMNKIKFNAAAWINKVSLSALEGIYFNQNFFYGEEQLKKAIKIPPIFCWPLRHLL